MHICLDFIPELLAQPQLEKQVRKCAHALMLTCTVALCPCEYSLLADG